MIMEPVAVLRLCLVLGCFTIAAETCSVDDPLDLIFIVDTSIDAATDVYKKVLEFIGAVIKGLDISETTTKIGVVLSDNDPSLILNLTSNKVRIGQVLHNSTRKSQVFALMDVAFVATDLFISEGREGAKRVVVALRSAEAVGTDYVAVPLAAEDPNLTKPANLISMDNSNSLTESANRIRNTACEATKCSFGILVDVMFVISATDGNYPVASEIAANIIETLDIKQGGTYAGLVNRDPYFTLEPMHDVSIVYQGLRGVPGHLDNQSPLQAAVKTLQKTYSGRINAIKAIVFITDHESLKPQEDSTSVELAKSKGYTVFTVAQTSGQDEDLLKSMASKPEYFLQAGDYSPLKDFIARSEKKGTCIV